MKIIKKLVFGMKTAFSMKKVLLLLWAFNLLFALPVYYLVYCYFSTALGSSGTARVLLKTTDLNILAELILQNRAPLSSIFISILFLLIFFYGLSLYLTGGILTLLKNKELPDTEEKTPEFPVIGFFQGAGKYFARFFLLSLYSLVYWIGLIIFFLFLELLFQPLMYNAGEATLFAFFWIRLGLALIMMFFIRMVLDYARIRIISSESRYVAYALRDAARFVLKNAPQTFGLYLLLLLTGLVLFGLDHRLLTGIPPTSSGKILLAFILGQIYILSQGWLKIVFQSSQFHLYIEKNL